MVVFSKHCGRPTWCCCMTVSTAGAKVGRYVVRVSGVIKIIDVARAAFAGDIGIVVYTMTSGTVPNIMSLC